MFASFKCTLKWVNIKAEVTLDLSLTFKSHIQKTIKINLQAITIFPAIVCLLLKEEPALQWSAELITNITLCISNGSSLIMPIKFQLVASFQGKHSLQV